MYYLCALGPHVFADLLSLSEVNLGISYMLYGYRVKVIQCDQPAEKFDLIHPFIGAH